MTHEVGLRAGVAVVTMVRDVFRPDFRATGPSPQVLLSINAAISELRQYIWAIERDPERRQIDRGNNDAAIIAALFLAHIAVSISSALSDDELRLHRGSHFNDLMSLH